MHSSHLMHSSRCCFPALPEGPAGALPPQAAAGLLLGLPALPEAKVEVEALALPEGQLPQLPALPEVEVEALQLALPELPALPEGQLPRWRLWHWSHGLLCLLVEVVEMIQLRLAIPHRCFAALSQLFLQLVSPRP